MQAVKSLTILPLLIAGACLLLSGAGESHMGAPPPIDPQQVKDQDEMTWDDYQAHPRNGLGESGSEARRTRISVSPSLRRDFADLPFVMTLPKQSDLFGNPQIRPGEARTDPAVLRRLLQQAAGNQSRPYDPRVLDGAVARAGSASASRRSGRIGCRSSSSSTELPQADMPEGSTADRNGRARWTRSGTPTPAPMSQPNSTRRCGSTPATMRRACGRSSAR